jgi:dihydrofolate reductase
VGKLIYSAIASVDGYVADAGGDFSWAAPDDEVHAFVNDLVRPVGTHLYGRRMYDVLVYWETAHELPGAGGVELDFARVWQAADKVVYSKTLDEPRSARTRIERDFDPAAVRRMKEETIRDLSIGGPTLAASAFAAELIDEVHLFLVPYAAGGGLAALPRGISASFELTDHRRFHGGAVYLAYSVRS